jgi:hypothetical protein
LYLFVRKTFTGLIDLGRVAAFSGDLMMARHSYEESLALMRELDFQEHMPVCLEGVAAVEAAQKAPVWAARLWGTAEVLREAMGTPRHPVYCADYEQAVAAARRELGAEVFAAAWAEGRATSLEQVIDEVLKT